MRTTIDLPDDLHRMLRSMAASSGMTLKALILQLVEQGLGENPHGHSQAGRQTSPPVILAPLGVPIEALSASELRRLDEDDDVHALDGRLAD